jgi:FAD/FMN-containing dehydrogenase
MPDDAGHAQRVAALRAQLAAAGPQRPLGLAKRTSNLFRERAEGAKRRLDLGAFDHVLGADAAAGWVDTEGLVRYEQLVDALLPLGLMPAVVPQLKTITAAGAVAGVGIEATSFRCGLVHDTLLALDVLLPDGTIVHADPDNEHADLFFGFPNSYGTLGYALRLKLRTLRAKPLVQVRHRRHAQAAAFFDALAAACAGHGDDRADFVDGVVFGRDLHVLSTARFVDDGPAPSDYTFERIYWQSLLERDEDWLSASGYLWRWDTDWFWNSKQFGLQHRWLRRLAGRGRLNSRTYTRWMRTNARLGLTRVFSRLRGDHPESVIQDVDIPLPRAAEFLDFLQREIGILPIWICPIRPADPARPFALYPLPPGVPHVNFGFWDVVHSRRARPPGHFNRLVEQQVIALGGIKSLYSDSFFDREQFDRAYGGPAYAALKARYDPQHRLLGLYDKCVRRA